MSFASLDTVFTLQSLNLTNAMNPRTLLLHYALVVDMAVAGDKDLAFVTPESPINHKWKEIYIELYIWAGPESFSFQTSNPITLTA